MVKNAGVGIAMKGSALEKKNIANFITGSNNENGVGIAIYQ